MYSFFKRFFDIILSLAALIVLLPLFIPIIIILLLTGEHEVFFRQDRVGYPHRDAACAALRCVRRGAHGGAARPASGARLSPSVHTDDRLRLWDVPDVQGADAGEGRHVNIREAVVIALRAVGAHRLRSALTMLGLVIGVSAVILLVAVGNGVQKSINARLQPLASLITVVPTSEDIPGGSGGRNLTDADVAALQKAPNVTAVLPEATGPWLIKTVTAQGGLQALGTVVGSTDRWLQVNNRDMEIGSFFDHTQARSGARVVVLGTTTVDNLFAGDSAAALGSRVQVNGQNFKVIGVLQSAGLPGDKDVVMPLEAARDYVFGHGEPQHG